MEEIVVSVPGKVILAGEHAVVYGHSALVASIDKRLRVRFKAEGEKQRILSKYKDLKLAKFIVGECLKVLNVEGFELTIESEIPIGGCGSSAALATGIVWAVLKGKSEKIKNRIVKKCEDFQHGKSSGVDQTIVREGGMLLFSGPSTDSSPQRSGLPAQAGLKAVASRTDLLLIDSGRPVESTGEMVRQVAKGNFEKEFKRMGEIAENWNVSLIKENQRLLEKIGVVGKKAKKIIREIEKIGGMAKVCGAGGVAVGSGIILAYSRDNEGLIELATTNRYPYYQVNLGVEGVKYE